MKKCITTLLFAFICVLGSYTVANSQVIDKVKKVADKTKDVTVKSAKKTEVIVTDSLDKAADVTKEAAKTTASKTERVGNNAVIVTENIALKSEDAAVKSYKGGKWFTVKTWDGTKWASKRVWYSGQKHDQ